MSKLRVKTTYGEEGPFASTETITLYCLHNGSNDMTIFYNEDGSFTTMVFQEWETGNDKWDAVLRLMSPYKENSDRELKEGVECWSVGPWEEK